MELTSGQSSKGIDETIVTMYDKTNDLASHHEVATHTINTPGSSPFIVTPNATLFIQSPLALAFDTFHGDIIFCCIALVLEVIKKIATTKLM